MTPRWIAIVMTTAALTVTPVLVGAQMGPGGTMGPGMRGGAGPIERRVVEQRCLFGAHQKLLGERPSTDDSIHRGYAMAFRAHHQRVHFDLGNLVLVIENQPR